MLQQHRLTTLDSGVRVVTEAMPSVRSVSLGFWIATGSRHEDDQQAGLSHLLEHLLFKGSEKYGSLEIDQIFDGMGAELNAGTGKETTSVYARVIDEHVPEAFDVMADMVFRPALNDVDSERAVILEEIAMYEDDPQEKVFDLLGEAVFGHHPLGRAIIGRADVIAETPPEQIARFHAERYQPENIVIAAAGAVEHGPFVELAARTVAARTNHGAPRAVPAPPVGSPRRRFERKDTEQYHVCLGGAGLSRHDERRFALRVLDTVFGGTTSSRLFQEIRERRG
ncbi:MAG: insulinase family protein, partial [Solirubrobacterales bacterium]|nr:insulinase family protein [Solirubrobacterales bacterium]